ncbi:MAG: GspE/PulE family protein [bacterium]|nr:GspE/PulE family protein [bacterium]
MESRGVKSVIKPEEHTSGGLEQVIRKEEEQRAQYLAKKLKLKYINLLTFPVESDAVALLEEEDAKEGKLAVIQKRGKKLAVAAYDPGLAGAERVLRQLKSDGGFTCDVYVASETSLEKAWDFYKTITAARKLKKHIAGKVEVDPVRLAEHQQNIKSIAELGEYLLKIPPAQTSDVVEAIVAGAIKTSASDVHFEAEETHMRLRYRIDGLLQDVVYFPLTSYPLILSRIKLLSGLKINIRDMAQDGRFTITIGQGVNIEVRTSILPGPYGENIVMRVLNPKSIASSLEQLGLRKEMYELVSRELQRTNGMILTTGPTGSGKTTSLYAFVKKVNTKDTKIITIEDPIEYHLEGIEQTQVSPDRGYTFATGLRAIIRQDPDVILVGEIRDYETAEIAMHSALTGHLVFATLHTNDAAGAIPRLINMGVNPVVIAPALNLVIAQRLVRKICAQCAKKVPISEELLARLKEEFKNVSSTIEMPKLDASLNVAEPVGCEACNQTGFKGRTGIFEAFVIDDEMEKFILQAPTVSDIKELAAQRGMMTMRQDGMLKIVEGVTTLEEVARVIG